MTRKSTHRRVLYGRVWLAVVALPWVVIIWFCFLIEGRRHVGVYYLTPEGVAFFLPFLTLFAVVFLDRLGRRAHSSASDVVPGRWRVLGPEWPGIPAQLGSIGLLSTVGVMLISLFNPRHCTSLSYLVALGIVVVCNRWRLTSPATLERGSDGYRDHRLRLRTGAAERPVEIVRADAAHGHVHLVEGGRTGVWAVLDSSDDLFALAEEIAPSPQMPDVPTEHSKR